MEKKLDSLKLLSSKSLRLKKKWFINTLKDVDINKFYTFKPGKENVIIYISVYFLRFWEVAAMVR